MDNSKKNPKENVSKIAAGIFKYLNIYENL